MIVVTYIGLKSILIQVRLMLFGHSECVVVPLCSLVYISLLLQDFHYYFGISSVIILSIFINVLVS
jgi:hypothetical protein